MRLLSAFLITMAGATMAQQPPIAKVSALSSGGLLLNGSAVTVQALEAEFERLKANGGAVWYYRENPSREPSPQALDVIERVIRHRLPVSLSSQADFSDELDQNGRSRPRTP